MKFEVRFSPHWRQQKEERRGEGLGALPTHGLGGARSQLETRNPPSHAPPTSIRPRGLLQLLAAGENVKGAICRTRVFRYSMTKALLVWQKMDLPDIELQSKGT